MSEIEKKWYVLRAVSGKENKVRRVSWKQISRIRYLGEYVSQVLNSYREGYIKYVMVKK